MRHAAHDGTYSLAEIVPVVGIGESTLFRWRWQARLFTAFDYLCDSDLSVRIRAGDVLGRDPSGAMPEARFDSEDVARLCIVGFMRSMGWDVGRLLAVLARPIALPVRTSGDGHSARYPSDMPQAMVIFAPLADPKRLSREVYASRAEAVAAAKGFAVSIVIDLRAFREIARRALAAVELDRERKTERYAREAAAKRRAREQAEELVL